MVGVFGSVVNDGELEIAELREDAVHRAAAPGIAAVVDGHEDGDGGDSKFQISDFKPQISDPS